MNFFESFRSSMQSIWTHKLRSLLTLLGIMIGVAAVVTMFSSVDGFKKRIKHSIEGLGWNNSLIVRAQDPREKARQNNDWGWYGYREMKPLTLEDYWALKSIDVPYKAMYGRVDEWIRYRQGIEEEWVWLIGANTDFFLAKDLPLGNGRFFNAFEEKSGPKICLVGKEFAEEKFPGRNPIGISITLGPHRCKIIGVLGQDPLLVGEGPIQSGDWERRQYAKSVFIPLVTGIKYLKANKGLDHIYMQAHDQASFPKMKNRVNQVMLSNHEMQHDFGFEDVGQFLLKITQETDEIMNKWNITLSTIASVSLLVGGIGLFSTLMISINEKMVEIGVRKGVGAKGRDIFVLFLMESVILAVLAASLGVAISFFLIKGVGMALKVDMTIPTPGILIGFGFSVVIGFVSGLYPAIKAARVNPIQAIFYFE